MVRPIKDNIQNRVIVEFVSCHIRFISFVLFEIIHSIMKYNILTYITHNIAK